jgi:hypothetical protein
MKRVRSEGQERPSRSLHTTCSTLSRSQTLSSTCASPTARVATARRRRQRAPRVARGVGAIPQSRRRGRRGARHHPSKGPLPVCLPGATPQLLARLAEPTGGGRVAGVHARRLSVRLAERPVDEAERLVHRGRREHALVEEVGQFLAHQRPFCRPKAAAPKLVTILRLSLLTAFSRKVVASVGRRVLLHDRGRAFGRDCGIEAADCGEHVAGGAGDQRPG